MNNFTKLINYFIVYTIYLNISFSENILDVNSLVINIDNNNNNNNSITNITTNFNSTERQARVWFPFYTIGRFQNSVCVGSNNLDGTCVLGGECNDAGGIATGSCNPITRQAICCVYQLACGATSANNNTYFVNPGYPGSWTGGSGCSVTISPCSPSVCQLKVSFLDLSLAPPNGDGICANDIISITGGANPVPNICGENSGQHMYVDFDGSNPISVSVSALSSYTFGRHWNIKIAQINCDDRNRAPEGCLQYYREPSRVVQSFNYSPSPSASLNSVGLEGSRQIANLNYGICVQTQPGQCSITWSQVSSSSSSFTVTGDVTAFDPSLLGTSALQDQNCNTDYVIIPNPQQNNAPLLSGTDRFCGLAINPTTSAISGNAIPFVLYVVTDGEDSIGLDTANRGFALQYTQNECPI